MHCTNCIHFLPRWLTPLLELTGQISEKYSMFFRRMGCAGEVTLSKDQVFTR